jgi:hypothetical protein
MLPSYRTRQHTLVDLLIGIWKVIDGSQNTALQNVERIGEISVAPQNRARLDAQPGKVWMQARKEVFSQLWRIWPESLHE